MKTRYTPIVGGCVLGLALAAPPVTGADRPQSAEMSKQAAAEPVTVARKPVRELTGWKIVNDAGDEIGKITSIVRNQQDHQIGAVVSVGGILGVGSKEVIVPLSALQLQGDQLKSPLARTEDQLKAQPPYEEARFDELPDQQMVDLGTARGTIAGGAARKSAEAATFAALDRNGDGYLSKEEASARAPLVDKWNSADQNRDGRIEESEFAAFEESGGMQTPAHQSGPSGSPTY